MVIMEFKPCYTWPNPAFHFRLYFNHDKCRIFIIENIAHNWEWLYAYRDKIRPTDYFLVQLGWYFDDWLADESRRAVEELGLSKNQFRIMFADYASKQTFEELGFSGCIINHNCFLDYEKFKIINTPKLYDAVYTARFSPFKRHNLCALVENLALIAGHAWGEETQDKPPSKYLNERPLSPEEVVVKINESRSGLILSEFEGACYSSSEYLLCGVPVVSTWSHGGRDVWYNSYNSITTDASAEMIGKAVRAMAGRSPNPLKIRNMHIRQSEEMRGSFRALVNNILVAHDLSVDIDRYFHEHYFHKMVRSQVPDFDLLFP